MTNYIASSVIYYPGYSQVQVHPNLRVQTIESITQSFPMILTTEIPHQYVAGMIVTFMIPPMFGMQELNHISGLVIQITSDTLTIDIDTTHFGAFSYPSPLPNAFTPPTVIPYSSGPYLSPPPPLPYGNQDSFEGVVYNNGTFGDPVNGD